MVSESKIKVKNPVVELDGDEVRRSSLFYSLHSGWYGSHITSLLVLVVQAVHFRLVRLLPRGNTGNLLAAPLMSQPTRNMTLFNDTIAFQVHVLTSDLRWKCR